jgi:two-component system OmpR family response regulator
MTRALRGDDKREGMRTALSLHPVSRSGGGGRAKSGRRRAIELQTKEFILLECLMRHVGRAVSNHFDPQTHVVDELVSRLSGEIGRDFSPRLIDTLRGGYVLRVD